VKQKKVIKRNKRNFAMPGSRHIFWNLIEVVFCGKVNLDVRLVYVK